MAESSRSNRPYFTNLNDRFREKRTFAVCPKKLEILNWDYSR